MCSGCLVVVLVFESLLDLQYFCSSRLTVKMLVWSGDAPLWLVSWLQHHDSSTNERPGGEQGAVADNHQLTSPEPAPPVSWRSHLEDCLVWQVIFYYLLSRYKSMILVFTSSITMFRWIWNVIKSCVNLAEAEWGDLRGLFWVNITSAAETHSLQIIRLQLLSENVARTCFLSLKASGLNKWNYYFKIKIVHLLKVTQWTEWFSLW